MTASLRGNDYNIKEIVRQKLHIEVSAIFIKTQSNKSRYLPLLECMTQIAKHHSKAASDFISDHAEAELIQDTKLTFYQYKKQQEFPVSERKSFIAGQETK